MQIDGLVKIDDISTRDINLKVSPSIHRVVRASKKSALEQDGWEYIPSKLKHSVRMRKPKSHNDAFEDRIWSLLAKMQFDYLNKDDNFVLEYAPGLTKQIDVFAIDAEVALIVECKSSATRRKVSYQKDINEIISMKDGLRQAVQKTCDGKPRVAFIFATNNAILNDNDNLRLTEGGIYRWGDSHIDYWEQLVNHLGPAAKYQLFGQLFAGQDIPNMPNKIPAIKGKMASGHTFYSFSIDPNLLLKIGFVLHRTNPDLETSNVYQRLVSKNRLSAIGKYIDEGGYFPNSIIVNIESKRKELQFDKASATSHDSDTSLGVLHLPRTYRSAFIIDGQHRLYGYSRVTTVSHHTVPVVAFVNLPEEEQTDIFVTINHTQKSVPISLLRSLQADANWDSDDESRALTSLKTRLLTHLTKDNDGPLYDRIVLAQEPVTKTRCLTLETVQKWGLSSQMGYFGKVKNKKLVKTGFLTDVNHQATLDKATSFFSRCFGYIEESLKSQWDVGSGNGGFIAMNIGVAAILRTMDHLLDYMVRIKGVRVEDLTGLELAEEVIPYLVPVVEFVDDLDAEGTKKLRSMFGSGAPEKVTMEFLNAIHAEFEGFNPEGLEQWIKEHTGEFNMPSWELGYKHIEPLMHDYIVQQLKKEFGEIAWWTEGVTKDIQKACFLAKLDSDSSEPDWNFLNTIHYRAIIDKNQNLLRDAFTPPDMMTARGKDRTSWLVKFNSIRQKYSHPQRDIITEEEFEYLQNLYEWLQTKLGI